MGKSFGIRIGLRLGVKITMLIKCTYIKCYYNEPTCMYMISILYQMVKYTVVKATEYKV